MDKTKIIALLRNKNFKDYSYNIFFFLIFTFFLVFAIRPNLLTAFELQSELQNLKLQSKQSEESILQILNYQSLLEKYRDKLHLLDEAVPGSPELARVVSQVSKSASDSGLIVESVNVESIVFKGEASETTDNLDEASPDSMDSVSATDSVDSASAVDQTADSALDPTLDKTTTQTIESPKLLLFTISIAGQAEVAQVDSFIKTLLAQRRLKNIESFSLTSQADATILNLVIKVYYL